MNERFIIQAKNDRRITDSAFRQQLIYTIGQVESIYWALVSAYEDEQAKSGRCSSPRNWPATTASNCRLERWRRWMW